MRSDSKIEQVFAGLQSITKGQAREIAKVCGVSEARVRLHLGTLQHENPARAHVCGWIIARSIHAAIWHVGPGENVPYPGKGPRKRDPVAKKAYNLAYRARKRQERETRAADATVARARQAVQNPFSALFL